jgi:hypothetical protein
MYRDMRVVAVVPAGRGRVLGLLLKHLRSSPLIDEIQLWENTEIEDDLKWMRSQCDDLVKLIPLDTDEPPRIPKQLNTGRFYRGTVDPDTVYIRFDDDIIYVHPDAISNLIDATLTHDGLCTFATIWNNAIISAIMQENGHLDDRYGEITRYCMDDVAWRMPEFGEYVHRVLLDHIEAGTTETLYFPNLPAEEEGPRRYTGQIRPLRFSVSCFAYTGKAMAEHADQIWHEEEETYMTGPLVEETGIPNLICGNALVSHYSFFTQRPHLDLTDVLAQYQTVANTTYHDQYYRFLGDATPQGTTT